MLVAWDTRDGDEILTSLNYPWDRCDPVWRSGKVYDRTSRGLSSILQSISIQCVFVSQCFFINLIDFQLNTDFPSRLCTCYRKIT